jgi:galactokinase
MASGDLRRFFAPGRVNLIGEHTDYSGGLVLPVALDLGVTATVEPAERIVLRSDTDDELVELEADGSGPASRGWGRYVAAVAAELDALGRPAAGMSGTVSTTLPAGAGLSSSAALEVAVATALCALADFAPDPLRLVAACRQAEERAVGVPCGIMDQAASLLGGPGEALLLDCGNLAYELVPLPDGIVLLVADSGDRHAHEHSGYADRRRELEDGLAALGGRSPRELDVAELGALDDLHRRRVRHVVTENARVVATVAALRAGDTAALGPLFRASHESLRDDYEVSTPALDRLVDRAYEAGAIAARMTGGGFGGSIVALAATADAERVAAELGDAGATVLTCTASAGARELEPDGYPAGVPTGG